MKLIIDTNAGILTQNDGEQLSVSLYSPEAFKILSREWLRIGWDQKYPYTFSWLGRPIIQLPEDMIRTQEVIYRLKPDVILETGVAHGGSLIFYASLCKVLGKGRVIGVDLEIRPHNRQAIENHDLASYISLIEGDSADTATLQQVQGLIKPDEKVLVILDSCHTKSHVRAELEAYHPLVSLGSYIVATDGIMKFVHDVPRGDPNWKEDHPEAAAVDFANEHPEFLLEQPEWTFNESPLTDNVTHWPGAWLRRVA